MLLLPCIPVAELDHRLLDQVSRVDLEQAHIRGARELVQHVDVDAEDRLAPCSLRQEEGGEEEGEQA